MLGVPVVPVSAGGARLRIAATVLLATVAASSVVLAVALWCVVASGIFSFWGPFWALPNEFLTGYSAAAGIALINCFGNLGGFVGPYALGVIGDRTGSFKFGLIFAGISLLTSAMLMLALRDRRHSQAGALLPAG